MAAVRQVRKRDYRVVPFDLREVGRAIRAAMRAIGAEDAELASELSEAVSFFVDQRYGPGVLGVDEVEDLIETVLRETGHVDLAGAFTNQRRERRVWLDSIEVRESTAPAGPPISPGSSAAAPREDRAGRGDEVAAERPAPVGWSRARIATDLVREAGLEPEEAETVARVVEDRVRGSGIQRVSTALLREIVDNELFEKGYRTRLRRRRALGLSRGELEQIIFEPHQTTTGRGHASPQEVRRRVADRVLERYALEEIYSPAVADAHDSGRILLHQLSDPVRLASARWTVGPSLSYLSRDLRPWIRPRALSAERTVRVDMPGQASDPQHTEYVGDDGNGILGELASGPQGQRAPAWWHVRNDSVAGATFLDRQEFFRELEELVRHVHGEIRLREVENLLLDGFAGGDTREDGIDAALRRLGEIARGSSTARLALELGLDAVHRPWIEGLARLDAARSPFSAVYIPFRAGELGDPERCPGIEPVVDLLVRGFPVEFVARSEAEHGGSGPSEEFSPRIRERLRRRGPVAPGLEAVAGVVTLNLAQAAFRSAHGGRGSIERELDEIVDLAVRALLERRGFLATLGVASDGPLWEVLGRPRGAGGEPLLRSDELGGVIGLAGLNECVKFLTGLEFHEDRRAVRRGLEIVRRLSAKVRKEEERLGIRLRLEETVDVGCRCRLEELDRGRYTELEEIDRRRGTPVVPAYTAGVRLPAIAPVDPLRRCQQLAVFLPHVRGVGLLGAALDLPGSESVEGGEVSGGAFPAERVLQDRSMVLCLLEEAAPLLECECARRGGPARDPVLPPG